MLTAFRAALCGQQEPRQLSSSRVCLEGQGTNSAGNFLFAGLLGHLTESFPAAMDSVSAALPSLPTARDSDALGVDDASPAIDLLKHPSGIIPVLQ